MIDILSQFAADGVAPVFAVVGPGLRERVEDLQAVAAIELVASPRQASVLLVAGEMNEDDLLALQQIHDMLPQPRGTVWWSSQQSAPFIPDAWPVAGSADPTAAILAMHRGLFKGGIVNSLPLLPDLPASDWRGIGPHRQGGKGMMGGKPYGRPMAMTADDIRDGLKLDETTVRLGPFISLLPPGLVLDFVLQGDLIQRASLIRPPHPGPTADETKPAARVAHHLRLVGRLLAVLDLAALGERCLRMAHRAGRLKPVELAALIRQIRRTGAVQAIAPGLGRVDRPGSLAVDTRGGEPQPAVVATSDVRQRLLGWLDALRVAPPTGEASHDTATPATALDNDAPAEPAVDPTPEDSVPAATEGASEAAPAPAIENEIEIEIEKASTASQPSAGHLVDLLAGLEWQQAMLVINSFDLPDLLQLCATGTAAPPDGDAPAEPGDEAAGKAAETVVGETSAASTETADLPANAGADIQTDESSQPQSEAEADQPADNHQHGSAT